jgi:hypothetical protein
MSMTQIDEQASRQRCAQRRRIHWTYYLHGSSSNPYPLDYKIREPLVLGQEMAGEVVETGPGVTKISVGQRVAVNPLPACRRCDYCLEFALINALDSAKLLRDARAQLARSLQRSFLSTTREQT